MNIIYTNRLQSKQKIPATTNFCAEIQKLIVLLEILLVESIYFNLHLPCFHFGLY